MAQMRAILSGDTPSPPISRLTGMRLTEIAPGTATFTMPLSRWLTGPSGTVPLGVLTMPADAAMGCAIMTELPARSPITTAELSLRLLHAPEPGGVARAVGRVVHVAAPMVLAEVEVRDDRGLLLAHGSSLYMTLAGGTYRAPVENPPPDGDASGPDPWERDLDAAVASPIELLTGLAPVTAAAGRATFVLPASPWLCAPPPGRVQGGMVALLAEAAMEAALQTQAPPTTTYGPVDLKINYLRPLASDGREARADARAVHAGRRIAVASAEVTDADGRPIAVATGSGLFAAAP
jgi:uncharacterized protein (TIGR00369 family)